MKKTRLCDLLDIEYPIIQGGMTWIANAELAAGVSNAGNSNLKGSILYGGRSHYWGGTSALLTAIL